MCGFTGVIGENIAKFLPLVKNATEAISYRGPDYQGLMHFKNVIFGHRRLAVVDLNPESNQPMYNQSKELLLVFNGEIYNFLVLRKKLREKGYTFITNSDTEVLLKSYEEWGDDVVTHIEGMFSFVIWDSKRKRCFAARDRFGEKPLYYAIGNDGVFRFASESHVISQHMDFPKNINNKGLGQFLSLGYCTGETTLVSGIKKLRPASTLSYSLNEGIKISQYWSIKPFFENKNDISDNLIENELCSNIDNAVSSTLISDVPLGAFLSGGIDSSTIVSSMLEQLKDEHVNTYSMSFENKKFDESEAINEVSKYLGIEPNVAVAGVSVDVVEAAFNSAARIPLADNSFLPTWQLSAYARKSVTVALSGDGGDELFAGYETYRANKYHSIFSTMPKWFYHSISFISNHLIPVTHGKIGFDYKLRQFVRSFGMSKSMAHHWWRVIFSDTQLGMLLCSDVRDEIVNENGFDVFDKYWNELDGVSDLDRAQYVDMMTWMPDNILEKVDRASMSHSLEVRAPFLNHHLAEWTASIPSSQHFYNGKLKYLLKRSQYKRLPASIINRKKRGFNAPVASMLNDSRYSDVFYDRIRNDVVSDYFNKSYLGNMIDEHRNKQFDHSFRLYTLACLGLWLEKY